MSKRVGSAFGHARSFLKSFGAMGYFTVNNIPLKGYSYSLTPRRFVDKSRLAYPLLNEHTRIGSQAKHSCRRVYAKMERSGAKNILFEGADAVAEYAFSILQGTRFVQSGVVDDDRAGEQFFGNDVKRVSAVVDLEVELAVVRAYARRDTVSRKPEYFRVPMSNVRFMC